MHLQADDGLVRGRPRNQHRGVACSTNWKTTSLLRTDARARRRAMRSTAARIVAAACCTLDAEVVERTLPIAMLCLALVAVPILVLEPEGLPRLRGLEKEHDDVTAENAESYREVERLRVEVRELRDDPAAVERIARGELGMVRKSEVVFQFGK